MSTSVAINLKCEFHQIKIWKIKGYGCYGLKFTDNELQDVKSVEGTHFPGLNNFNVKMFEIEGDLNFFPLNISNFFPNLESLSASRTKIENISRKDLQILPKLKEFIFNDNKLKFLDDTHLFDDMPLLAQISFNNNPIIHVASNLFKNLRGLKFLHFYKSKCLAKGANNRQEVIDLTVELLIYCPPTIKMIEDILLEGQPIKNRINKHITERLQPWQKLYDKLHSIGKEISDLKNAIEKNRS